MTIEEMCNKLKSIEMTIEEMYNKLKSKDIETSKNCEVIHRNYTNKISREERFQLHKKNPQLNEKYIDQEQLTKNMELYHYFEYVDYMCKREPVRTEKLLLKVKKIEDNCVLLTLKRESGLAKYPNSQPCIGSHLFVWNRYKNEVYTDTYYALYAYLEKFFKKKPIFIQVKNKT